MEDKGSGKDVTTVWKLDDPEVLRKEKALKEEARMEKLRLKEEAKKRAAEKEAKAKIAPQDMFRGMIDLYSKFGEKPRRIVKFSDSSSVLALFGLGPGSVWPVWNLDGCYRGPGRLAPGGAVVVL